MQSTLERIGARNGKNSLKLGVDHFVNLKQFKVFSACICFGHRDHSIQREKEQTCTDRTLHAPDLSRACTIRLSGAPL